MPICATAQQMQEPGDEMRVVLVRCAAMFLQAMRQPQALVTQGGPQKKGSRVALPQDKTAQFVACHGDVVEARCGAGWPAPHTPEMNEAGQRRCCSIP